MTKRLRLGLVVASIAVAASFLTPTLRWYFWTSEEQRQLAALPLEQIRLVAVEWAQRDVGELRSLAVNSRDEALPERFEFLIPAAGERLALEGRLVPRQWTVAELLSGFPNQSGVAAAAEDHYRQQVLDLKQLRDRTVQLGLDLRGGMYVVIEPDLGSLEEEAGRPLTVFEQEDAMRRALEILNNRVDTFGLTEPIIRQQGDQRIIVELPGEPDPERMRSFILGKGRLAFHIVEEDGLAAFRQYQADNPNDFLTPSGTLRDPNILPAGSVLRGVYEKDAYGIDQLRGYTVLHEEPGLSGTYIRSAQVERDPVTNQPTVNFVLTGEGGEIFFKLTGDNVGNVMAVVLDDRVKATATIQEPIRDAVRVSGFSEAEAGDLALVLRTGALPVPLDIVSQQSIGASLGEDAIRQGVNAVALGLLLVLVFMIGYYHLSGVVADFAMALNLFFMVSVLSVFGFTLTLPSLAGVILTVGISVDANVIIYERIREEYRLGKTAAAAVRSGFAKAFWTVMDSNITTLIAALALSQLGSGPIQGFAVTLAIGVVCSMFTALFVSRLVFDFAVDQLRLTRLSIGWGAAR